MRECRGSLAPGANSYTRIVKIPSDITGTGGCSSVRQYRAQKLRAMVVETPARVGAIRISSRPKFLGTTRSPNGLTAVRRARNARRVRQRIRAGTRCAGKSRLGHAPTLRLTGDRLPKTAPNPGDNLQITADPPLPADTIFATMQHCPDVEDPPGVDHGNWRVWGIGAPVAPERIAPRPQFRDSR